MGRGVAGYSFETLGIARCYLSASGGSFGFRWQCLGMAVGLRSLSGRGGTGRIFPTIRELWFYAFRNISGKVIYCLLLCCHRIFAQGIGQDVPEYMQSCPGDGGRV